jgi:hypothetical protein
MAMTSKVTAHLFQAVKTIPEKQKAKNAGSKL